MTIASDAQVSIIAIQVILTLVFIVHARMFSDIIAKHRDQITKVMDEQEEIKSDIAQLVEARTVLPAVEQKGQDGQKGKKKP
jgi:peptidoglycan hydrolase CwlO-like protein